MTAAQDYQADGDNCDVVQLPATVFFTEKGGLVVARLGEVIRDIGHVEMGVDGRMYRYTGGVYRADGDLWARAQTRMLLGDRWGKRHAEEVVAWLRSFEPAITDKPDDRCLNVTNGLLDWRSGTLHPHTPDVLSTIQLGASWDPDAACPRIEKFLDEVLPADAHELIYEVAGYSVFTGNPLRQAILLLGPGRNGKTKLLDTITALAGRANVASIPLQVLAENRFAAAELFGKVANLCGDLDARGIKQTDIFKMATGGDVLLAERKHGHPFTFAPFANFVFAANEAPITSDQSDGWFDRWVVIPMEQRIADTDVDPKLLERLTTPAELSGLLTRAVTGLQRLMDRGRFPAPASVVVAGEQYRDRLDTVRGFVNDECVIHLEAKVERSKLYKSYRTWSTESGRLPVSVTTFNEHLRQRYPMRINERTVHGTRMWQGIGLAAGGTQLGEEPS